MREYLLLSFSSEIMEIQKPKITQRAEQPNNVIPLRAEVSQPSTRQYHHWHFKSVSPYFMGDERKFYELGFNSVNEMLWFAKENHNYEPKMTDSVLDIGCGVGRLARFIAPAIREMTCIDISEGMVEAAKDLLRNFRNVTVLKVMGDGILEFPNDSFNFVFSHGTLGFVRMEVLARYVAESYRCLKPNGVFTFQIPNYRVPLALITGCDLEKAIERVKLLFTGRIHHPTERSKLGVPQSKEYLQHIMEHTGFENIHINRPSIKRIYYLVSGMKR